MHFKWIFSFLKLYIPMLELVIGVFDIITWIVTIDNLIKKSNSDIV